MIRMCLAIGLRDKLGFWAWTGEVGEQWGGGFALYWDFDFTTVVYSDLCEGAIVAWSVVGDDGSLIADNIAFPRSVQDFKDTIG